MMEQVRRRARQRAWDEYNGDTKGLDHKDPGYRRAERKAWHRLQKNLRIIDQRYGVTG